MNTRINPLYSRKKLFIVISIVITILICVIVNHNERFYQTPVAKLLTVETTFSYSAKDGNGNLENHYIQNMEAVILNGARKGEQISLKNEYGQSLVYGEKYKKGEKVFLTLQDNNDGTVSGVISTVKRDQYIVGLVAFFFLFLILFERRRGFFTAISLVCNIAVFSYALDLYTKGVDIFWLSIGMGVFFCVFSLLCMGGFHRKTMATIIATLLSVGVTIYLADVVIYHNKSMDYAMMEYLIMPNDAAKIFMSELLIGCLGAIMDVAITMTSSVWEMQEQKADITRREVFQSGREIGSDIMGTMINVLLFTYICGGIPFFILAMKNGISMLTILNVYLPFELIRFLTGSIGILLTIPISLGIALTILWKRKPSV